MSDNIRIITAITPNEKYPRHSEGDFIRLRDGSIMLIYSRYFGGSYSDLADAGLAVCYSHDNGESWTEPTELLHPSQFGVTNIMSVSLMRMLNGDIGLFFGLAEPGFERFNNRHILLRSSDEGKSFRHCSFCDPTEYSGYFGLNNSRVERLASGRLITAQHIHPGAKKEQTGNVRSRVSFRSFGVVTYSDDDGYTWKTSPDIICPSFTSTRRGLQEGGIIEIAPNILKSYFRTDKMYQYEALSFDGGEHWTAAQPSCFTAPWSPLKITRNPFTGKLYAIWNPIPLYNTRPFRHIDWGRTPYVYAELNDDASAFGEIKTIEAEPDHGYCYPAVMFTAEDEMLIAYCSGGPEDGIGLAKLTVTKIKL